MHPVRSMQIHSSVIENFIQGRKGSKGTCVKERMTSFTPNPLADIAGKEAESLPSPIAGDRR
jgi:hypothetical protein